MNAVDVDTARAALSAAADALGPEPGLDTYLARGDDLDSADVTRIELATELAAEVRADLVGLLARVAEQELLPYDPSYQPSAAQALVSTLGEVPVLARLHDLVGSDDVPVDQPDGRAVRAMAHRLHHDGTVVAAYRVKGAGIATRRPRGLHALLPRDGVYEPVDHEILYYEPRVDAWVVGEHVFVTTRSTLEQRLHAPERAREMARATFATATARVAIEGVEALAEAVSTDPVMIAKMASIVRTMEADPDFAANLTTSRLVDFVEANPHYGVTVSGAGDDRRLVFEPSPSTRYRIVKLLADDFLRSDLTNRSYEAGSKHQVVSR